MAAAKALPEIFPYDEVDINKLLCNLMSLHFITCHDGVGYVENFKKHQNPHPHEAKSTLPEKPEQNQCHDMSVTLREMSPKCNADVRIEDSLIIDCGGNDKPRRFTPPTTQQVQGYMDEVGYAGDAERFVDHYASKGWVVGKSKMKDWKAAVRTWRKGDNKQERKVADTPDWLRGVKM